MISGSKLWVPNEVVFESFTLSKTKTLLNFTVKNNENNEDFPI